MCTVQEASWRYPGWRVVMVSALSMVATLPGRTVGLGLITEPLLAELQLAKTQYATLTIWATMLGALFSLGCGPAIDRWGIKKVLPAALMCVAISVISMGYVVTSSSLLAFLILSRGFGQSSLSTASVTAVGKWFSGKLGVALGVFSALVAFGFALTIFSLGSLLTTTDWRVVWMAIGGAVGCLGLVAFVLLPRRNGISPERADANNATSSSRSLRFALSSSVFWLFTLSTALYYLLLSGLTLFNEAILAELGFDHSTYILAMTAMMGAGLIGNFLYGWLTERMSITKMLSINLLLLALVLISFPWLINAQLVIAHAALYGIVGGAFAVLFFTGYGKAFGPSSLGKIQGVAQVVGVIASALGPKLLAETEAATGSFLPNLKWFAIAAGCAAVWAWCTRDLPQAPTSSPSTTG